MKKLGEARVDGYEEIDAVELTGVVVER